MSATAAAWATLAVVLLVASFRRPAWAVALYMLTFFAAPQLWWWGSDLPSLRYALLASLVLAGAATLHAQRATQFGAFRFTVVHGAAVAMAVNATFVHFALASDPQTSLDNYVELLKFLLLFFLVTLAIHNRRDFRLVLIAISLGAAYIGYEVTLNDRGHFSGSRLEGVGAPGAISSNSLANVMLMALPLIGSLFVGGRRIDKLVVIVAAPLALNVLLLCNSRGAFLGLIGAGLVFLLLARGATRKQAVSALAMGGIVLYLLLGDARIFERFTTTFVGSEDRDQSAASRLEFWQAGLKMIKDYPLGAGGNAFKYVHGARYLADVTGDAVDRSLHNGFLTEATEWGLQGLFLRLLFIGGALAAAYRTANRCRLEGRTTEALMGTCVLVAAMGFLIHNMFGVFLSNEWGYWIIALLLRYHQIYQTAEPVDERLAEIGRLRGVPERAA